MSAPNQKHWRRRPAVCRESARIERQTRLRRPFNDGVVLAAADGVSALTAAHSGHAQIYQAVSAQAARFTRCTVNALQMSSGSGAARAANVRAAAG